MQPCDSSTDNAFVNNTSSSFSDSFLGFDGQRPVFKDVLDVVCRDASTGNEVW
jgi:hypothetical protein